MSYTSMAGSYDVLTRDVDRKSFFEYYKKLFALRGLSPSSILDIGCGTGTLAYIMADAGYDVVAADPSEDMLSQACMARGTRPLSNPLFLRQSFATLDLYGTVDAAVCSLDCVNYITGDDELAASFARLGLFIAPGGLFIFDVNSVEKYSRYKDSLFIDQTEDMYCVWRADYDPVSMLCRYSVDIFTRRGELWELASEEHIQRAYAPAQLSVALESAGFGNISFFGCLSCEPPIPGEERIFVCASKL